MIAIKKALSYDDVLLVPQCSDISSRKEIDIGSVLNGYKFGLPIISSPMDTVTWAEMANSLSYEHVTGYESGLSVLHRYCSVQDQCRALCDAIDNVGADCVAAAVGVTGNYEERVEELWKNGCRIVCVDVAHGHHDNVAAAISYIKSVYSEQLHVMAGNVATAEGYMFLAAAGADSIRVGVGSGSICSTRIQTGHGIPTLQSLLNIRALRVKLPDTSLPLVIADGGIRTSGDIVKALAAGADFVMLGSLLAGTDESPGSLVQTPNGVMKEYRGMASAEAQNAWRGYVGSEEGITSLVPYKGSVGEVLESLAKGIRSGFSYSGARNLAEFQAKAQFVQQTSAGQVESSTHINGR